MSMRRHAPRAAEPCRGSATVEFGLTLALLLLLAAGVVDLGRALLQYNTLAKSVRVAARHLGTLTPGTGHAAVRCLAVTGSTDTSNGSCEDDPLVPGLTPGAVVVCDRTNCADHNLHDTGQGQVHLVSVQIQGLAYVPLTGLVLQSLGFSAIRATFSMPAT